MRYTRLVFVVLLGCLLGVTAAACGAAAPAVTTAAPAGAATQTRTPLPSRTPAPTATPRPTFTLTASPTPSATLPPTPTADANLSQVKLTGLAWLQNYDLLLSFDFPTPVQPDAYRVTLEDKPYACQVLAQYPRRLYCTGQGAKVLALAWVRVYPAGSDRPGYEKQYWVPYFDNDYSNVPYNPPEP